MDFAQAELGPKMAACSAMERRFVWALLMQQGTPSYAQAARDAGYSDVKGGAKVSAHNLMHRDRVLEALDEVGRKAFRGLLIPAVKAAAALIDNPKHQDHLKTVLSTLSRLGLGEQSNVAVQVSGEVAVNHTDAALNDLRIMRDLG